LHTHTIARVICIIIIIIIIMSTKKCDDCLTELTAMQLASGYSKCGPCRVEAQQPVRFCQYNRCNTPRIRMPPIGRWRANGREEKPDWEKRQMHCVCYGKWMQEQRWEQEMAFQRAQIEFNEQMRVKAAEAEAAAATATALTKSGSSS
jgi:hypothetical protein